ncbi:MAG: DUF4276 family protein [Chloroflexota bacterium]|nr:DUF4276 family protein [Chloroflexota bacterium]MDE2960937.1 DUF4276 family protein [Chloroflexota bacterium]
MIRLAIAVEGETEEEFVKQVLAGRLRLRDVEPIPYLLMGNVNVPRLSGEMARLFTGHDAVTSLVDFYGFEGKNQGESVEDLEHRILTATRTNLRIAPDPFLVIPYVQLHEFEGLLFADTRAFGTLLNLPEGALERLQTIREQFETPEDINNDTLTAPSKRIANIIPRYNKKVDGPMLAEEVGLDRICSECPRFNEWIADLEALAE